MQHLQSFLDKGQRRLLKSSALRQQSSAAATFIWYNLDRPVHCNLQLQPVQCLLADPSFSGERDHRRCHDAFSGLASGGHRLEST